MAKLILFQGGVQVVKPPIELTTFQILVGGFIEFVDLASGDLLVINEYINSRPREFVHFANPVATVFAGVPLLGNVIVCSPWEVA